MNYPIATTSEQSKRLLDTKSVDRKQIRNQLKRAWVENHFHNYGLSDEEVEAFRPLPSDNFSEAFTAGAEFVIKEVYKELKS